MKMKSFMVTNPKEIVSMSEEHKVVGIDEAQFFDSSILDICKTLASKKNV